MVAGSVDAVERDALMPFRVAVSGRDMNEARSGAFRLTTHMAELERRLADARQAVAQEKQQEAAERARLTAAANAEGRLEADGQDLVSPSMAHELALRQVEGRVRALRADVDAALELRPPGYTDLGDDHMLFGMVPPDDPRWLDFDAQEAAKQAQWYAQLDAHEADQRARASAQTRDAPVAADAECTPADSAALDALSGIHLALTFAGRRPRTNEVLSSDSVGPGTVGPYRLVPYALGRRVAYYVAWHVERQQEEWIIGVDEVDTFAAMVDLYVGAARTLLPGSKNLPSTQADGADTVARQPSLLELEASGAAAELQLDGVTNAPGDAPGEWRDGAFGAGPAAVNRRNADIRIDEYTVEAERIAKQIKAEMADGVIDPVSASREAVDGRNRALHDARGRMSPGARMFSEALKEEGKTLAEMRVHKAGSLLAASDGAAPDAMRGQLGVDGDGIELRRVLAADDELWEQVRRMGPSGSPEFRAALTKLGQSPVVAKAIVHSAGKTNPTITAVAKFMRHANTAGTGIGALASVVRVATAEEGQRLHVAAKELAGFAGGALGADLGAGMGAWIASLLRLPHGAVVVVSVIGGVVGGISGTDVGVTGLDGVAQVTNYAMTNYFGPGAAQAGAYGGLLRRPESPEMGIASILEGEIYELDTTLDEVAHKITDAKDADGLQSLQRLRLTLLDRRGTFEAILGAIRGGTLTTDDVWQIFGVEEDLG